MVLFMTAWTPHVTVATVVEKDGRFLFVEEHSEGFVHTVFNQPAGHVECGETIIEAAIRETLEETGHHVEIDHCLVFIPILHRCFQIVPITVFAF
jgi:ADP-ribose pyrophosphatase YjhB (NUDIX family)